MGAILFAAEDRLRRAGRRSLLHRLLAAAEKFQHGRSKDRARTEAWVCQRGRGRNSILSPEFEELVAAIASKPRRSNEMADRKVEFRAAIGHVGNCGKSQRMIV